MSTTERIQFLLEKYRQKTASLDKVDELFSAIGEEDIRALLDAANFEKIDRLRWEPVLQNILKSDARVILESGSELASKFQPLETGPHLISKLESQSVLKTETELTTDPLSAQNADSEKKSLVIPFWRRYRWIAAASVLIIASSVFFLTTRQPKPEIPIVKIQNTDVLPGGNKAMLTLGNGSKIILDSAHNGSIALQGNTNIIKTDSGKLSYLLTVNRQPSTIAYNTLSTPRGGQYQLELPDGTKVWLNAASSITYPTAFAGSERNVEVTGEAYFEVKKNPSKPFIVKNQNTGTRITVLGTHFNVNMYGDEPENKITLLEGAVNVSTVRGSRQLAPGEQARVHNDDISIAKNVDVDNVMAWKNGYFSFHNADLPAVMRQLSRWYDVKVEYQGPVPTMTFGGEITRNTNASQVLKILEASKVHFLLKNHTIIVTQ